MSEPPKKDDEEKEDAKGGPRPRSPGKPRGKFDDETMVGLEPIAPIREEEKPVEKKKTIDDPTMKHVANAPRPAPSKYDDETMRKLAPLEPVAEPAARKKIVDETMIAVSTGVSPVAEPETKSPIDPATGRPRTVVTGHAPPVEPTLAMAPEPLPALDASWLPPEPASPPAKPITRPAARFDPTMTSGLTPIKDDAPPPATAYAPPP